MYSAFMAKVHLTDTESEVEAAGEAAKEAADGLEIEDLAGCR